MPLTLLRTSFRAVIAAGLVLTACEMDVASTNPTLVEVWIVGDDGLTQRLRVALENAFGSSPDFTLSVGKKPGTLVVEIPTNVHWKKIAGRGKAFYSVEFNSTDGRVISTSTGSCWEDTLSKCATKVVKDAKIAARKIP